MLKTKQNIKALLAVEDKMLKNISDNNLKVYQTLKTKQTIIIKWVNYISYQLRLQDFPTVSEAKFLFRCLRRRLLQVDNLPRHQAVDGLSRCRVAR